MSTAQNCLNEIVNHEKSSSGGQSWWWWSSARHQNIFPRIEFDAGDASGDATRHQRPRHVAKVLTSLASAASAVDRAAATAANNIGANNSCPVNNSEHQQCYSQQYCCSCFCCCSSTSSKITGGWSDWQVNNNRPYSRRPMGKEATVEKWSRSCVNCRERSCRRSDRWQHLMNTESVNNWRRLFPRPTPSADWPVTTWSLSLRERGGGEAKTLVKVGQPQITVIQKANRRFFFLKRAPTK